MGKIKTVKVTAKGWWTRSFFEKCIEGEAKKWAKRGYRLVNTTPITKTKKGLIHGTRVETTDYLLTFEKE